MQSAAGLLSLAEERGIKLNSDYSWAAGLFFSFSFSLSSTPPSSSSGLAGSRFVRDVGLVVELVPFFVLFFSGWSLPRMSVRCVEVNCRERVSSSRREMGLRRGDGRSFDDDEEVNEREGGRKGERGAGKSVVLLDQV